MAVVDRIFEHARATPDRLALIADGRRLTFADFARAISAVRQLIAEKDLDPARTVLLCISDLMAVWTIGLALRSLGLTTLAARSADDLERLRLGPANVVRLATEAAAWPGLEAAVARSGGALSSIAGDLSGDEIADVGVGGPDGAGAHILLTSGTTGDHKKVLIDAAAEAVVARANIALSGLTSDAVFAVFNFGSWTPAGYFWAVSAWTLGAAVIIDQSDAPWRTLSPEAAVRPTIAVTTPFLVRSLLSAPPDAPLRNDAMALLVVGGQLSAEQWRAARARLTGDLRAVYGATETGPTTTTTLHDVEDLQWHQVHPQCQVEVVDEYERPLPAGEIGRVRMRPTRVDGYLDDPDATRTFFRDGFFYPGDLGKMDARGRLSLQGRITDVINVMGDKIGVLPMETLLEDRLDAVAVCVFSAPAPGGDEVHVAIQLGRTVSAETLKDALLAALPGGVAGVHVHAVQDMPRNDMGKIERRTLMRQLLPGEG